MPIFKKLAHSTVSDTKLGTGLDEGPDHELHATDGPTGIRVVSEPPDAVVDIVFIHGLTGNREKTWTHRNGTFWPDALLSQDLPRARIMTFGYDADVVRFWTIASSNRLDDHAKSLAYALLDRRAHADADGRPIVFVAHSLGGLVCKEALNLSNKRHDLASIMANTLGIVFMGTPHGGSHLARWGRTVARYVDVFRGTNRALLENLQPGSSDLLRTAEDFQHMLRQDKHQLRIYCFYEALRMSATVGKVVDRESAILPAYDNCSINADHRSMTKFTGRADAGYAQVRGVLERWVGECGRGAAVVTPSESAAKTESTARGRDVYNGPVFNGAISGRYVVPGPHTTGGTVNFNFSA